MSDLNIPTAVRNKISPHGLELLEKVKKFVEEECIPADKIRNEQLNAASNRWETVIPVVEELKQKAKSKNLWNLFLPFHYKEGPGLSNLEYALMAEQMGRCNVASEAMNCAAPDTGNMEVFAKYGSENQKKEWLVPLMNGEIRSAFCMTERFVASSDATNIGLQIVRDGNEYVLNGRKWWASGAGDPRCKVWLVMGKTNPNHPDKHKQQSVVIVPANHPGSKIIRPMKVFNYDDAPHGHCEIVFENCRIPISNIIAGEGRGFEIIQGRLGPGRIHHCMRLIGAAEQALQYLLVRVTSPERVTFGKQLSSHGTVIAEIAKSRIEIEAGRLLVLNAAASIDAGDSKSALREIAYAKVFVPNISLAVIDRAIQAFGAEGVSQDTALAYMWANARTLRIADGPDEVHIHQIGRRELQRAEKLRALFIKQSLLKTKPHL